MQYYRGLLQQASRIEAFRRAIQRTVGPKDRVLEVGTGLGTYSFFAADAGADRVWAVDGNAVIHVAETVARLNGYEDKIEFTRGWIPDVAIPETATVLVFEDFPSRLLDSKVYRLFVDLHRVYLAVGVKVVPARASLFLAPMTEREAVECVGGADEMAYGIDWACSREYSVNTPRRANLAADSVSLPPVRIAGLDFAAPPETWQLEGSARWSWERDTAVSGIAYWFDLELSPGEWLSNAPGAEPASWGQLLLPLDPPLRVKAGQELRADVRPELFPDGAPGWLTWSAVAGGVTRSGHEFRSEPASFGDLYDRSPDARPRLSSRGALEAEVLRLTDGRRSVSEIAAELQTLAPELSPVTAVCFVIGALSGKSERVSLPLPEDTGG